MASRKLDVRWPEPLLLRAEGIAAGAGVRTAEVLRRAAAAGLEAAARELRGERAAARGERVAVARAAAAASGKMAGAGAGGAPSVVAGADVSPRPSAPASARVRLDVVVARLLEGGHDRGPAPVSLARARRRIAEGAVLVAGERLAPSAREAGELVDPAEVELDG